MSDIEVVDLDTSETAKESLGADTTADTPADTPADTTADTTATEKPVIKHREIFQSCFNIVKMWAISFVDHDYIEKDDLLRLSMKTILLVETSTELSGKDKKNMVIHVMRTLIESYYFPEEHPEMRTSLLDFIDNYLSYIIDQSISLAKGELDIGKKPSKKRRCFCWIRR